MIYIADVFLFGSLRTNNVRLANINRRLEKIQMNVYWCYVNEVIAFLRLALNKSHRTWRSKSYMHKAVQKVT